MADKRKFTRYATPIGTFIYPRLVTPDTKFDADGMYSCRIAIPEADAQELIDLIKTEIQAQANVAPIEKGGKMKWADPPFEGDGGGNIVFSAKQRAHVKLKDGREFDSEIRLYDAKGNLIERGTINPWSGTRGRLSLELFPYSVALTGVGVSLRIKAAQIVELVEGGASAASYGFHTGDGDFVAPPKSADDGPECDIDDDLPF